MAVLSGGSGGGGGGLKWMFSPCQVTVPVRVSNITSE